MNIIFLDIDGVLNYYSSRKAEKFMISQDRMMMIADLARRTGSQIVITSTWRLGHGIGYFQELFWLMTCLTTGFFKTHNGVHYETPSYVIDVTPRFHGCERGWEIEYWLQAYEGTVSNYVIIDDDDDMLEHHMPHFVQTIGMKGILKGDILKAEKILKGI